MLPPGVLKILIVGANNLDKLVAVGEQQPYYILECGTQRSRSKPCLDNGCNPTWSIAHKFNLTDEVGVVAVIKDEVTKGVIGQGVIELARARQYGKDEGAAVLMNLGGNPAGTLRYKLKFSAAPGSSNAAARVSEAGSHASAGVDHTRSPRSATALSQAAPAPFAPAAAQRRSREDDPMLASVTSKVSLAKQAMQQLTAELAELTGADAAADPSAAVDHQGLMHGSSLQERHDRSAAGAAVGQQRSLNAAGSFGTAARQPRHSSGSVSPMPASPALSPNSSLTPGTNRANSSAAMDSGRLSSGGGVAGWHASWRGGSLRASHSGAELSTEELLAMYGKEAAVEQLNDVGIAGLGHKQLLQQLQEALAAAHAEKVASDDELNSVKQAMAVMSKQHYLDMKRVRDNAAAAAAAAGAAGAGGFDPAHGIRAMVDTHPPKINRQLRQSQDSSGSLHIEQQQQQQHDKHQQLVESLAVAANRSAAGRDVDAEDDWIGEDGSPVPAYKLQIQIHQLERQLAEQAAKTQEEVDKREALVSQMAALQAKLDAQVLATRQAEANAKAAEAKAAEQATQAAAARAEVAAVRADSANFSGKEAQLSAELSDIKAQLVSVKAELSAALTEKAELEEALGLMEKNNSAQVAALQAELSKVRDDAEERLEAAREQASGMHSPSEEVEYLQAQLRRTLRQVVELQHQVQVLQNTRPEAAAAGDDEQDPAEAAAIKSEYETLMQELVNTKLELAELKEQQVLMQRQLFKAQESIKRQTSTP